MKSTPIYFCHRTMSTPLYFCHRTPSMPLFFCCRTKDNTYTPLFLSQETGQSQHPFISVTGQHQHRFISATGHHQHPCFSVTGLRTTPLPLYFCHRTQLQENTNTPVVVFCHRTHDNTTTPLFLSQDTGQNQHPFISVTGHRTTPTPLYFCHKTTSTSLYTSVIGLLFSHC